MRLPGEITISRPSGTDDEYISIKIECAKSHVQFVEARVLLAAFARALTGRSVDCTLEVRGLDKVGMRYEHQRLLVWVPDGPWGEREARAKAAVELCEVDGWKGRVEDALNHHNRRSQMDRSDQQADLHAYEVFFSRHVPDEEPAE